MEWETQKSGTAIIWNIKNVAQQIKDTKEYES